MRYEVKLGGARHCGRFLPYGNIDPHKTMLENALDYVANPNHAERFALSAVKRGGKGRAGQVVVMIYDKDAVYNALVKYGQNVKNAPALAIHNGGVALKRIEYMTMRQTFGAPIAVYETDLTKVDDIEPDAGCVNAPYARAWEKICAKVVGGRWCGGLLNVQIDFVVNDNDE